MKVVTKRGQLAARGQISESCKMRERGKTSFVACQALDDELLFGP